MGGDALILPSVNWNGSLHPASARCLWFSGFQFEKIGLLETWRRVGVKPRSAFHPQPTVVDARLQKGLIGRQRGVAGGNWVDEEVVVDGHLVTSRTPDDLPAFMRAIIGVLKG